MQSQWYQLNAVLLTSLKALAEQRGVRWLENPPLPIAMDVGDGRQETLFLLNRGDRWLSAAGLRDKRSMRFVLGAASARKDAALAFADELHFAARAHLRGAEFMGTYQQAGALSLDEVEVEPDLQSTLATGAVLLSAFETQYHQQYPNAAR